MTTSPPAPTSTAPTSTASPLTRALGVASLVGACLLVAYGIFISPPDRFGRPPQLDAVRIMYVHVPAATWMSASAVLVTAASALWLRKRTPGWDALAVASAEIGTLLTAITLATGSLWGRPTWGVYWVWDARLTSTALQLVMFLGYLALRRYPADPDTRSRLSAFVGLALLPNVIIVRYSVNWWRSLHQPATLNKLDPSIEGTMLFALMTGIVVAGVVCAWLLVHRFRVAWLEGRAEQHLLDEAIHERRADDDPTAGVGVGPAVGVATPTAVQP